MPKIIEDIESKIIDAAESLMFENEKAQFDMRQIAKTCGLAVGTIYNYFPTKKDIFIKVFERSWIKTFNKLNEIIETKDSAEKRLNQFFILLNTDDSKRHSIGKEVFERELMFYQKDMIDCISEAYMQLSDELTMLVTKLVKEICVENNTVLDENDLERLAFTVLVVFYGQTGRYPNELQNNVDYTMGILRAYLKIEAV